MKNRGLMNTLAGISHASPAWLAVATAAFVAGCGGGEGGNPQTPNEARLQVARSGDLVAYFKAKIAQRVALGYPGTAITVPTVGGLSSAGSVVTHTGAPLAGAVVEEDALIKSEGNMLYGVHRAYATDTGREPPRLAAMARAADGSLSSVGSATLDAKYIPQGFYVAGGGTRAAVLSQQDPYADRQPVVAAADASITVLPEYSRTLSLDLFAIHKDMAPAQIKQMRIDGLLVGSRLIGNMLYLVTTWSPDLTRFTVPAGATASAVDAALKDLNTAALIPTLRVDGGQPQPLVNEADCLVQTGNASLSLQLTSITAIDLTSSSLARTSRCFAGGSEAVHLGARSVYVASSRQYRYGGDVANAVFPADSRTDIHKFSFRGAQVDYDASGSVDGHLGWDLRRLPSRLNEYQNDLRVLTFTGKTGQSGMPPVTIQAQQASPALLTVLRDSGRDSYLGPQAKLPIRPRTARGDQQIDNLFFAGARAYATPFTNTEPVWVLDLANPANPTVAGELAAGGHADHLVPLPNGLLLGVGKDSALGGVADGIQLAVFDVRNAAQGKRLAAQTAGGRGSITTLDSTRPVLNLQAVEGKVRIAFPARVYQAPTGVGTPPPVRGYQGALRLEVNTTTGALAQRSMVVSTAILNGDTPGLYSRFDIANERSLQVDNVAYQLSGGQVFTRAGD